MSIGNHVVAVSKTGYGSYSTTQKLRPGSNSLSVTLTTSSGSTGDLYATSSPSIANLYVDGSYKGLTPLTVSSLSVGNHIVAINKTGYDTYSETKYISEGNNSFFVYLIPSTGSLSVTSSPSSANLYIDGSYKGLTPLTVSSLSIGNHVVIVNKTGYDTYSETKYISEGSNSLNVTLTPVIVSNQTNQTGSLSVTSSPSSADLYIDDSYKGLTPFTVLGLSVGYHDVKLIKSGYYVDIQTRNIFPGNNSLNVILTPLIVSNSTNSTNQTG